MTCPGWHQFPIKQLFEAPWCPWSTSQGPERCFPAASWGWPDPCSALQNPERDGEALGERL